MSVHVISVAHATYDGPSTVESALRGSLGKEQDVTHSTVRDAMDLPYAALAAACSGNYVAVVAVALVETDSQVAVIAQALLHVGFTQGVPVIVAVNTGTPRRNSELRSGAVLTARVRKVLELGPLSPTEPSSNGINLSVVGTSLAIGESEGGSTTTAPAAAAAEEPAAATAAADAASAAGDAGDGDAASVPAPVATETEASNGGGAGGGAGAGAGATEAPSNDASNATPKAAVAAEEAAAAAAAAAPDAITSDPRLAAALATLREGLLAHGARGIVGLGRKFRILNDDGNSSLNMYEFTKGLRETGLECPESDMRGLFKAFDTDNSGSISFDEFLVAIRGQLNARRKAMVSAAYKVLDKDGSGVVDMVDIVQRYDASKHPEVAAGKRAAGEVLKEFLETFDAGEKDGKVTLKEFERYYANISASIDDDDYFELVIRNAWHISGGEGWAANTTCRRVLVTHTDGSQTVEEIENDMDIEGDDVDAMKAQLRKQGVTDLVSIDLHGSTDNVTPPTKEKPATPSRATRRYRATESSIVFG